MNEQEFLKASERWSTTDQADNDQQMMDRVKGRLMQAQMDLYRLDNFSFARVRAILEHEVKDLAWLIDAKNGNNGE